MSDDTLRLAGATLNGDTAAPLEAAGLPDLPAGLPASPGRRRALALALLVAVLGLVWLGGLGPLLEGLAERQEHEARQMALLQRLEPLRAEAPVLRRQLDSLEAELAAPDLLLRAGSANQAAAQLQTLLRRMLDTEGLAAEQFQPLPALPEGNLTRVAVRVELRATLAQLHGLLRAVEAHRPLLSVGDALVAASRGGTDAAPGALTLRLDFRALSRVVPGDG